MPHEVTPGPLPNIVLVRVYGHASAQDISLSAEELGLDQGRKYVLMDASEMSLSMPDGAINAARNSYLTHENLAHVSLVTASRLFDMLANMVAKLTGRKNQISIHPSRQAAMDHLVKLASGQTSSQN